MRTFLIGVLLVVFYTISLFHDDFACFSYVHGLPRDVEEIMQITCPAFHVHPMSSKFALTDSYMYQNK